MLPNQELYKDNLFHADFHHIKMLKFMVFGSLKQEYNNWSAERQKGLSTSHLHAQLDPFASKLMSCDFDANFN